MTPDEQEAGSIHHVSGVQVVPLSSGSWGLLPRGASSATGLIICQSLAEAEPLIRQIAAQQQSDWQRRQPDQQLEGQVRQVLKMSLEDLGL